MIKDLFIKRNEYIIEYQLTDNLYLYIEGLNCFGNCITQSEFDINNIENLCVELHKYKVDNEESLICGITLDLDNKLDLIKDYILEELVLILGRK